MILEADVDARIAEAQHRIRTRLALEAQLAPLSGWRIQDIVKSEFEVIYHWVCRESMNDLEAIGSKP